MKFSKDAVKHAVKQVLEDEDLQSVILQEFDDGDVVATPDGKGVVAAEMRDDFRFPTGEKEGDDPESNTVKVEAGEDNPAYVVGFGGSSAVYRASSLESSSFNKEDAPEETDGEAVTPTVSEVPVEGLPEGWDTQSLLDYWASIGGSVSECETDLQDEEGFDEERAIQQCADFKDMVIGTERWRNRF